MTRVPKPDAVHGAMGLAVAAGVAFLAVTAAVAAGLTRASDRALLEGAQQFAWPLFDVVSSVLSAVGGVVITGLAALGLTIWGVRRYGVAGVTPLALIVVATGIEYVLKRVIGHPAPPADLLRDFHWLAVGDSGPSGNAFPSGHLSRTTLLAFLAGARWSSLRWPAGVLVALMAVSRVYSASHWTSDVVGGICLGLALFGVALFIERRAAR